MSGISVSSSEFVYCISAPLEIARGQRILTMLICYSSVYQEVFNDWFDEDADDGKDVSLGLHLSLEP